MSILNAITVCIFTLIFIVAIVTTLGEEEFAKAATWAVVGLCFFILYFSLFGEQTGSVSKGEYYATQCQLIETNIDNGLFQSNTNKLKCGDVIENVTVDDYQEAIKAYQESLIKNEK